MLDFGKVNKNEQLLYARRLSILDGRHKGLEVVEVFNNKIHFFINVSNGFDILSLEHLGTSISLYNDTFLGKHDEFLSAYEGGFLYTCGLDSFGSRCGFKQHGEYHHIKADNVKISLEGLNLTIKGEIMVDDSYGKKRVIRTYTLSYLDENIRIKDQIINLEDKYINFVLLYHFNFAYPFLDERTYINAKVEKSFGYEDIAKSNIENCFRFYEPDHLNEGQTFCHTSLNGNVEVISPSLNKKVTIKFDNKMLPYVSNYRSFVKGSYFLSIEPSTTLFNEYMNYSLIKRDESVVFDITINVSEVKA